MCINTWWENLRRGRQTLLSSSCWLNKRKWAQTRTYWIPREHEKTVYYCEGGQTSTGCPEAEASPSLEILKNPDGQSNVTCFRWLYLIEGHWSQHDLKKSLSGSAILWPIDSVTVVLTNLQDLCTVKDKDLNPWKNNNFYQWKGWCFAFMVFFPRPFIF